MTSTYCDYEKGQTIFRMGDTGNTAYILTNGAVEISIEEGKNKTVLAVLHPISVFGEMALLLKDQKRTATARAKVNSKVAKISKIDFNDFVNRSPKLITAVLKAIVSRLQNTTGRVSHSPELYTVITENLNLLVNHNIFNRIRLDHFTQCVSKSYKISVKKVHQTIQFLETIGLIELRTDGEQTTINVIRPIDFMARATKIYKTFSKMGTTPDKGLA